MQKVLPFILSSIITAVIMTTISLFIEDAYQAKSTFVSGLIAAFVIAAVPLYSIESWSLPKRSLVHFFTMAITVLPLVFYSSWFSPGMSLVMFGVCGLVGWAVGYVIHKFTRNST